MKRLSTVFILILLVRLIVAQQPFLVLPVGHTSRIMGAEFSPDGKRILTASDDNSAKIWDAASGALLIDLKGHNKSFNSAHFSSDGKKIITDSWDATKIWDATTGALLIDLKWTEKSSNSAQFSSDGKKIVVTYLDKTAKIWDANNGTLLTSLKDKYWINFAQFSPDGQKIVTTSHDYIVKIWNALNGSLLYRIEGKSSGLVISGDGNKMATLGYDSAIKIWDINTGKLLNTIKEPGQLFSSFDLSWDGEKIILVSKTSTQIRNVLSGALLTILKAGYKGYLTNISWAQFSRDGNKILTRSYYDNLYARLWDGITGNYINGLDRHDGFIQAADFSPDSKKIVTASADKTAKIWDASNGSLLAVLTGHTGNVYEADYDATGTYIITRGKDNYSKKWNANSGSLLSNKKLPNVETDSSEFSPDRKLKIIILEEEAKVNIVNSESGQILITLSGHSGTNIEHAEFSPDGKKVVTAGDDYTAKIWDVATGELLATLFGHKSFVLTARFSADGKKIFTTSLDHTAKVWDAETGKRLADLKGHTGEINTIESINTGNKYVTSSMDHTAKIWDAKTGAMLHDLKGHTNYVWSAKFSPDGKNIVTSSEDNTSKIWDVETGELKYTFIAIDSMDFLVTDQFGRYDGSEGARKLLYFTCGLEIIKLDQIKDLCWEPNLAEKIMGTNKEPIKAKRLDEISICGATPIIEKTEESKDKKKFKIIRRSGGIGEVAIYINQKEVEKIPVASLVFNNNEAFVTVDLNKYANYFETGKDNSVQLQARTADMSISTRGAALLVESEEKVTVAPNLYAIIAGVSDYKGSDLDLKYASKDAADFSNAIQLSSRKLLNIDGKEHVFVTTLVSGSATPPVKENIRKAFEELKSKAKANDIVVVYVSGHGEKFGTETTNFYYLTADAASFNLAGVEKEVAISTNEFADWLKAIPARKQLLILDACASGKLAEDMAIAMRAAVPSDQIKALDRLNSRTGTFILSGAAANQSAYETSMYGQGLLTYSLLYGMKSGEALKDNNFVDVDKLFQYCADKVKELAKGIGGIQDPVISKPLGGASFDVGKVDQEVVSKIILALPKMIFTNSKFSNRETDDDNLGLEKTIDDLLNEYSSKGKNSKLVFTERSQLAESYKLVGSYQISNNKISITVRVKKGTTEIQKFEINNYENDKEKLAKEIFDTIQSSLK